MKDMDTRVRQRIVANLAIKSKTDLEVVGQYILCNTHPNGVKYYWFMTMNSFDDDTAIPFGSDDAAEIFIEKYFDQWMIVERSKLLLFLL